MSEAPLRRIVRNSIWGVLGIALGGPMNLAVSIALARGLGVESLGVLKAVIAGMGVIQLVVEAGLSTVIVRRIVTEPEAALRHLGEARGLLQAVSAAAFVLTAVVAPLVVPWEVYPVVLLVTAGTLVTLHAILHASVFRAREEMGWNAAGFLLQKVLFFLFLLVVFWAVGGGVVWAAGAFLLSNLGLLTFYTVALHRRGGVPPADRRPAAWGSLVRESVPLGFGRAIRRLTWQVDTLLLAALSAPASVGLYRAAYDPIFFLNFIPNVVALPLFPLLSRLAATSPRDVAGAYGRAVKVLVALGLPTAAVVTILAERIVLLAYGEPFRGAAPALRILIWCVVFLFFSSLYPFVFASLQANRAYAVVAGAGLLCNFVLDLVLIPRYDYVGACWATLAAEAVLYAAGWAALRRLGLRVPLFPGAARPAALAALLGALLWWFRDGSWPAVAGVLLLGGAAYLAGLRLTGAVTGEELRAFREALRRKRAGTGAPGEGEGPEGPAATDLPQGPLGL